LLHPFYIAIEVVSAVGVVGVSGAHITVEIKGFAPAALILFKFCLYQPVGGIVTVIVLTGYVVARAAPALAADVAVVLCKVIDFTACIGTPATALRGIMPVKKGNFNNGKKEKTIGDLGIILRNLNEE